MKKILLFTFLFTATIASAQDLPIDPSTDMVTFTEVVTIDQISASEAYLSALKFYNSKYNTTITPVDEADQFVVIGPMTVFFNYIGKRMEVNFDFDLRIKDQRYKYTFTNFIIDTGSGTFTFEKGVPKYMMGRKEMPKRAYKSIVEFTQDMKKAIQSSSTKDDW